jgi:hypothetical protein
MRQRCGGTSAAMATMRAVYAILEFPDGPALSVGYRSRAAAEAALRRLLGGDARYARYVVAEVETVTPKVPVAAGVGSGQSS